MTAQQLADRLLPDRVMRRTREVSVRLAAQELAPSPRSPVLPPASFDLAGHVAIVTGANCGIGAATARVLAGCGAAVLATYLRLDEPPDPGVPHTYRASRAADADAVVAGIRAAGGRAATVEADLADPSTPAMLLDAAEAALGPVDILINNASGWRQDTFSAARADHHGRRLRRVTATTIDRNLAVDARAAALLIAQLARRHSDRHATWGRIVGLTSGGPMGFPEEVSYGAAKAAQESYTMAAALELAASGITANIVYPPVTDTGWITETVRAEVEASAEHLHIAEAPCCPRSGLDCAGNDPSWLRPPAFRAGLRGQRRSWLRLPAFRAGFRPAAGLRPRTVGCRGSDRSIDVWVSGVTEALPDQEGRISDAIQNE